MSFDVLDWSLELAQNSSEKQLFCMRRVTKNNCIEENKRKLFNISNFFLLPTHSHNTAVAPTMFILYYLYANDTIEVKSLTKSKVEFVARSRLVRAY